MIRVGRSSTILSHARWHFDVVTNRYGWAIWLGPIYIMWTPT